MTDLERAVRLTKALCGDPENGVVQVTYNVADGWEISAYEDHGGDNCYHFHVDAYSDLEDGLRRCVGALSTLLAKRELAIIQAQKEAGV